MQREIKKDGRTLDQTQVYVDLSELSKEEINNITDIINKSNYPIASIFIANSYRYLHLVSKHWFVDNFCYDVQKKQEITYPDFLQLFGESELAELPEKWFIRGGEAIKDYFAENKVEAYNLFNNKRAFLLRNGYWDWAFAENLEAKNYTEIIVSDYKRLTGSSKIETTGTFAENVQDENLNDDDEIVWDDEEESVGNEVSDWVEIINDAKKLLQEKGYFVFPKAPEGDFPDLSGFPGVVMSAQYGDNTDEWHDMPVLLKHMDYYIDLNYDNAIEVRPIQKPRPTIQELWKLAEEAGADLSEFEKPV